MPIIQIMFNVAIKHATAMVTSVHLSNQEWYNKMDISHMPPILIIQIDIQWHHESFIHVLGNRSCHCNRRQFWFSSSEWNKAKTLLQTCQQPLFYTSSLDSNYSYTNAHLNNNNMDGARLLLTNHAWEENAVWEDLSAWDVMYFYCQPKSSFTIIPHPNTTSTNVPL